MSQVAFASRGELIASLHSRIEGLNSQIDAVDSEIRSVQHEQAARADASQTRKNSHPHPHSREGRKGIKMCKLRLKELHMKREEIVNARSFVRNAARFHENIVNVARPLNTTTPMRKL